MLASADLEFLDQILNGLLSLSACKLWVPAARPEFLLFLFLFLPTKLSYFGAFFFSYPDCPVALIAFRCWSMILHADSKESKFESRDV